ncbi:MAG: adenosylhomocysteinase [Peptococcaceae bacterium]|nr:adenosylhomocysteinase [Peptococcaceae bacterium]
MDKYSIKDIGLASEGELKIEWARNHMPVLNAIREEFERVKPFKGIRVAMSIHLEAKTAYLAQVIKAGGAEVAITGSNPLSTQDDIAAALAVQGINVYAWHGVTDSEYRKHILQTLDTNPKIIIDDGGDLVNALHKERRHLAKDVLGGSEETTTGVIRLKSMDKAGELLFPMMAVNDARCKYLFDNRYGTGESVMSSIMRTTNLLISGKSVVVMGYGWCGRGVAIKAKGLGAKVIICEVDPIRAIEAVMDGYQVMSSNEAARIGDMFITVTGCCDILRGQHYKLMKNGAILANAGHFDLEINKHELSELSVSRKIARKNIEEFTLENSKKVYLLGEGRLVNLAAGDGHPVEIMDMSFALQALSARHILDNSGQMENKVYQVPEAIDQRVAAIKLESLGIAIDHLTLDQQNYLESWNHS